MAIAQREPRTATAAPAGELSLEEKIVRMWAYLDVKRVERDAHGVLDVVIEIAVLEGRVKERTPRIDTCGRCSERAGHDCKYCGREFN